VNEPQFDPGLTNQFSGHIRRTINKDGSFNVRRRGVQMRDQQVYMHLVSMSWPRFLSIVTAGYFLVNILFALLYVAIGVEHLQGAQAATRQGEFMNAFFFSVQTFTTVGYGVIAPRGFVTSMLAAVQAMCGLLGFALATGLLYGRFSRPSAKIRFSEKMLVAPYQDGHAFEFRIANARANVLMELEAKILLMTVAPAADGQLKRSYDPLKLERPKVYFFPLTWTVVHPIEESSPLWGKTAEDLKRLQAEFLILVKGFDETFGQTVHVRHSYTYDEIAWQARFLPAFATTPDGDLVLELDRMDDHGPVATLPA
jgi:inward rectifier potassium channel